MRNEKTALVYKYNALIKKFLDDHGAVLSNKEVALAVSGGSDSVFLATLLLSSKKPLFPLKKAVIVHVNHHWREEAKDDEDFVKALGERFKVSVETYDVYPRDSSVSAELEARNQRKAIFKNYETVLTGHTSDDLYETILWKTLQGRDPGTGIKVVHENEIRPLLFLTKDEIQKALKTLSVSWKEDRTNHDGKLLRSKMRAGLMKVLDQDFPEAKSTVVKKALAKQVLRK